MLNGSFTTFPILTTERLTLRQLVISDEQEIFTLRSDSEVNRYLDRPISHTIDDARNFINRITESESLYWAITFSDYDILVGTICLFGFSEENYTCEIGFELLTNFQGQGIMMEAVDKVIEYAFNTIEVRKIEAIVHNGNHGSISLLQKFSFRSSNQHDIANPDLLCFQLTSSKGIIPQSR